MSRFLVVLLLLIVAVVGLGFYLGWFHFSSEHTDQSTNYKLTVDKDKIKQDQERAKEKIREAGEKVKESTRKHTEKNEGESPRP